MCQLIKIKISFPKLWKIIHCKEYQSDIQMHKFASQIKRLEESIDDPKAFSSL